MSTCDQMFEWMSAALDGALNNHEQKQLEEHLEKCPSCARLYQDLCAMEELFNDPAEEAPEGFAEEVMERIHRESMEPVVPFPLPKRNWKRSAYLAGVAVFAVVLIGYGSSHLFMGSRTASTAATERAVADSSIATAEDSPSAKSGGSESLYSSEETADTADAGGAANSDMAAEQFVANGTAPSVGSDDQIWYAMIELKGTAPDVLEEFDYTQEGSARYYTVSANELDRLEGELTALGYDINVIREGANIDHTAENGVIVVYTD